MKQFIVLDWDGNLAKTLDIWLEACRVTLEKRGLEVSDEEIASSFGAFTKRWKEWGINDVDAAIEEADAIVKVELPNVELYPDVLEVLESLYDRGKTLALITTSEHENVEHLLEKYNIARFFDAIIAGDDVQNHKPHPEPLEKALNKLGGKKGDAIMIKI